MFRISILVTMLLVSVIPGIARNNSRYVDPFIGTGAVEGGLSGNNYPGATAPFGMVQLSPDTHRAPDWYIYLNGKKHKSLSLSRQDLARGGSLHFEL